MANNIIIMDIETLRKNARYLTEVITLMREKYSQDDEMAILRQRDTKPQEFETYNNYAEWCKLEAKKL